MIFRPSTRPNARMMAEKYAACRDIPAKHFFGKARTHDVAHPRQDCMRMLRDKTRLSLPQIGRIFNRDHTTVIHGIKASERRAAQ